MKTNKTVNYSEFVRKNVEVTVPTTPAEPLPAPGTQFEIPFGPPDLAPPPQYVDLALPDYTQLEIVPFTPVNWRMWIAGTFAGLGLGLLISSRELQDAVTQTLYSLNLWK